MGRKKWSTTLCLAIVLGMAGSAYGAPDRGEELFRLFIKGFTPERAQMTLLAPPNEAGYIPMLYITMKGARVEGMRVERATLMAYRLQVTPPRFWQKAERPDVLDFFACNAKAIVTQKDANDFFANRSFQDGRWRDGRVVFGNGTMHASIVLHADLKVFRATVRLEMETAFDVVDDSQIWLDLKSFDVNGQPVPTFVVRDAVKNIQPLLNLKDFGLPIRLARIVISPGLVSVETLWKPIPFSGMTWTWDGWTVRRTR